MSGGAGRAGTAEMGWIGRDRVRHLPIPRENANRSVNCTIRMLFAWLLIWPNAELLKCELVGAAHWTI
ncbi:MAG: hypothetical protein ACREMY_20200 [bacterium]